MSNHANSSNEIVQDLEFAAPQSVTQNIFLLSSIHVNWFKSNENHKIHLKIRQKLDQNYELHAI